MSKDNIEISKEEFSPIQKLINAHMQYIESLEYLKPTDFANHPEKLLEKQINYTISNALKFQELCRSSLSIVSLSLTTNPVFTMKSSAESPMPLAANFPINLSDNVLGRISNSIFTPTYLGINPFEMVEKFVSNLTNDPSTPEPTTATIRGRKTKIRKTAAKSKKTK